MNVDCAVLCSLGTKVAVAVDKSLGKSGQGNDHVVCGVTGHRYFEAEGPNLRERRARKWCDAVA